MDTTYTITLSDGSEITGLRKNGDNFISDVEITEEAFTGKLAPVTIAYGDTREEHAHMDLVQITRMGAEYWFVLRDVPQKELEDIQLRADVDFIAMMADIEL